MTRDERRFYQVGIASAAAFIIAAVIVLTAPKNAECAAVTVTDGYFIAGTDKVPEKGQIRANSAMPCDDPEGFAAWYETYFEEEEQNEPETEEEARPDDGGADHEEAGTDSEPEPVAETTETQVESSVPPLYRIAGEEIDESIQVRLYQHLQEAGIPYWYEIGLCQMFQESSGNVFAVSKDGRDMGILQFRAQYWDWDRGDIFNADAQMQLYSEQMAARLNAGLSADECISRHKTSDYSAAVDWTYVQQVKQHLPMMEAIR